MKKRQKGEVYRPVATVEKMKNNEFPSVLIINGRRYVWDPDDRRINKKGWKGR